MSNIEEKKLLYLFLFYTMYFDNKRNCMNSEDVSFRVDCRDSCPQSVFSKIFFTE